MNINSQISPRIFEKIQKGSNGILGGLGTLIHEKNLKLKISCQNPFKYNSEPFLELDHERGELGEQDL
jgi:hypothetical protein